jgi:hypothetical protein
MSRSAAELLAWLEGFEELALVDEMWDSDDSATVSQSNQLSSVFSQFETWFASEPNRVYPEPPEAPSEVPISDPLQFQKSVSVWCAVF